MIPNHGGYRHLKTFQLATVIYDVTVRFCEKYLDPRSRTCDQMTQAARSGRQNIAEGSVDSATSKKIEMKLTGVAKGSLEELRLDYEDYLRQRGLPAWNPEHPALARFKARRCASLAEFREWVAEEVLRAREHPEEHGRTRTDTDKQGRTQGETGPGAQRDAGRRGATGQQRRAGRNAGRPGAVRTEKSADSDVRESPCPSVFVANGALSLLNLCIYLLDRQVKAQAAAFEREGGFTEKLYRTRTRTRRDAEGDHGREP